MDELPIREVSQEELKLIKDLKEEIDRLRAFASAQRCKCRYYGDGDWVTCHRCYVLGIKRGD